MNKKNLTLPEAEWTIMECLWEKPSRTKCENVKRWAGKKHCPENAALPASEGDGGGIEKRNYHQEIE